MNKSLLELLTTSFHEFVIPNFQKIRLFLRICEIIWPGEQLNILIIDLDFFITMVVAVIRNFVLLILSFCKILVIFYFDWFHMSQFPVFNLFIFLVIRSLFGRNVESSGLKCTRYLDFDFFESSICSLWTRFWSRSWPKCLLVLILSKIVLVMEWELLKKRVHHFFFQNLFLGWAKDLPQNLFTLGLTQGPLK